MNKMISSFLIVSIFLQCFLLNPDKVYAATIGDAMNPTAFQMSSGDFVWDSWNASNANLQYPSHMIFQQRNSSSEPTLTDEMTNPYIGVYNGTSKTRMNGLGADGASFINTGDANNGGYLGAAVVAIDTQGRHNIKVAWTGGTVVKNLREYRIRLQYRVGIDDSFTDLTYANGNFVEYIVNEAGHKTEFEAVTLPIAADNQPYVQLRWKYYYVATGASGARPQLRVDDIQITSDAISAPPSLPTVLPKNLTFIDQDGLYRKIGGTLGFTLPANEDTITHYKAYFLNSDKEKIGDCIASSVKGISSIPIPIGTAVAEKATYIGVFSSNAEGESLLSVSVPIVDTRGAYVCSEISDENAFIADTIVKNTKYQDMEVSPFAFYRATSHLYYEDLAQGILSVPSSWETMSNINVWNMGDAHTENLGFFGKDANNVVFDINDFDEAFVGPFYNDLLRMVTSIYLMYDDAKKANQNAQGGFSLTDAEADERVRAFLNAYKEAVQASSGNDSELALRIDKTNVIDSSFSGSHDIIKTQLMELESKSKIIDGVEYLYRSDSQVWLDNDKLRGNKPLNDYTRLDQKNQRVFDFDNPDLEMLSTSQEEALTEILDALGLTAKDKALRLNAGLGSRGVTRFYVLLEGASDSQDDDVLLDIKQQLGANASRAYSWDGFHTNNAQRIVTAAQVMFEENTIDPYLKSVSTSHGTYTVSRRSPWRSSLDFSDLDGKKKILAYLQNAGRAFGYAHSRSDTDRSSQGSGINYSFDDNLISQIGNWDSFCNDIMAISKIYYAQVQNDYQQFKGSLASDLNTDTSAMVVDEAYTISPITNSIESKNATLSTSTTINDFLSHLSKSEKSSWKVFSSSVSASTYKQFDDAIGKANSDCLALGDQLVVRAENGTIKTYSLIIEEAKWPPTLHPYLIVTPQAIQINSNFNQEFILTLENETITQPVTSSNLHLEGALSHLTIEALSNTSYTVTASVYGILDTSGIGYIVIDSSVLDKSTEPLKASIIITDPDNTPTLYTVCFDAQGGNEVATVYADYGSIVDEPTPPVRKGYIFSGWYKEKTLENRWLFSSDTLTQNITLFAKWIALEQNSSNNNSPSVSFTENLVSPPAALSNPLIKVSVNGQLLSIQSTTSNVQGQLLRTININSETLNQKITEALVTPKNEGNKNIEIDVPYAQEDQVSVFLSGDSIKKMDQYDMNLSVKMHGTIYRLPAKELRIEQVAQKLGIAPNALQNVQIQLQLTPVKAETAKQFYEFAKQNNYEILVPGMDFAITAKATDLHGLERQENIAEFNQYIERSFEISEDIAKRPHVTGVLYNADGSVSHIPTKIIQVGKQYYAKLNSRTNSSYGLIQTAITVESVNTHWSKECVNDLAARLIIRAPEHFTPNNAITRGEFAEYITKALGIYRTNSANGSLFKDIATDDELANAVTIAAKYGIINGYPDGTFKPKSSITRQEAMVMYAKAMHIAALEVKNNDRISAYKDKNQVANWAYEEVVKTLSTGIFNGRSETKIMPQETFTYAEAATALRNLLIAADLIN